MNPTRVARILVVDDEPAQLRALCDILGNQGYEPVGFAKAEDALKALPGASFDLLLTDLMMPGMDGVELLREARKIDPLLVGILMTGQGTIATAVNAMQSGAVDYVLKPFTLKSLLPVLTRAMEIRRLQIDNMELRNSVAIHELNQAIAHTLDPNILLTKIADAALGQFEGDEASIMLLSDDGSYLYVAAVRGDAHDMPLGTRQPIGEGIAGWVAANHEPRVLEGRIDDPDVTTQFTRADIRSSLSMPMITRGKLIGVLNVSCTRRPRPFPNGQVKALSIFTNAAAASIEAARLHEARRRSDARYREVLDMVTDGFISIDQEQRIIIFSAGAEEMFGYQAADVIGKPLEILLQDQLADAYRQHVAAFARGSERARPTALRGQRLLGRRKDGTLFNAEMSIAKHLAGGEPLYTVVVRDITERVQDENKIARLNRTQVVKSSINSAIVRIRNREKLCDEVCRIVVEEGQFRMAWIGFAEPNLGKAVPASWKGANDGYLEEVGLPLRNIAVDHGAAGRALREGQPIIVNDIETDPDVLFREQALRHGYRSLAVLPIRMQDSVVGVIALYAAELNGFDQDNLRLLTELAGDISLALEVMAKEDELAYLARHDVLTGLPNRTTFNEQLSQRAKIARHERRSFAVVVLDLERFRNVNETLGRHVGDTILKELARRLTAAVTNNKLLAHFSGDQFAIATGRIDNSETVWRTVKRLLDAVLGDPFDAGDATLRLAARAGIAVYPADGVTAEDLVCNAEAALKESKRSGGKYQFYAPTINATVARTLHLENRLRGALERGEFVLHYQPKVEFATGDIAGFEALLRWQDPESGLVAPTLFIPLLEETGLIVDVGSWAMQEAVRTATALRAAGFPSVRIAVNVSAIQLREENFVRRVEEAITLASNGPHGLDLEITESVIMHDIEDTIGKLDAVRTLGVELAIDDFGTGYSSLAYIGRLPVSMIKIDKGFIRTMGSGAGNMPIVHTIIALTHALERKVVAEGVETKDQARALQKLNCDQYQGFLFSKPLPAEEIGKLLRAQDPRMQNAERA